MPGPSQRLKFDVVLPGVLLGIAPGGGMDGEALYDMRVNLRIMRESTFIDFRDAGRDGHIGQIDAAVERLIFDTGDAHRDGDASKVLAAVKGAMADFFDTPRDRYALQAFTVTKNEGAQLRDTLRDDNGS